MFDYTARKDLLQDRVILVTGAGDGIGRAAAKCFAEHGATVILLGRTVEKLEAVYDEIRDAGFTEAVIFPMDLESVNYQDYENLANGILDEFGRLDGVLHNAGLLGSITPIDSYPVDRWFQVMQVNLNAAFLLSRALLPLMQNADNASMVFSSSTVGRVARAYWGAYSVSKAAVENLMQVLAEELEATSSIRVNSLNPGGTRTSMRMQAFPAEDPATRPAPEEIMNVYLYLMGPDSIGITGQQFNAQ